VKKIVIASSKGGVGKTIIAVHLSDCLSDKNLKITLVDGDTNKSSTYWTNRIPAGDVGFTTKLVSQYQPSDEDLTIADLGGEWTPSHLAVIERANLTLVPTSPDALSVTATIYLCRQLERLKINYRIVLNNVPPFPSKAGLESRQYLESLKLTLLTSQLSRSSSYLRASLLGKTVRLLSEQERSAQKKQSLKAWQQVIDLSEEVEGLL